MTPAQEPDEQNARYSELLDILSSAVEHNGGWLGFDQYMQLALYAPGLGYYSGGLTKFGAAGDFITAPEMGGLFARCIATQVAEVLVGMRGGSLLEFGAGSGALAAGLLNELERLDALPEEYLILELSGDLRARQRETIAARAGRHLERVRWLETLPQGLRGVVIANEVLDAMPVKLFEQDSTGAVSELGVAMSDQDGVLFRWQARPADAALETAVRSLNLTVERGCYRSELAFQAPAWIQSLGEALTQGVVLLIDYGFPRREYYHPDRAEGTLICHYRHRSHDDPFYRPGQQDITSHVDFTAIAESARAAGFGVAGYTSQAAFLLATGLLEKIPLDVSVQAQLELAQEVRKLTMPHEMGELFKVLALTRGYPHALSGFSQRNDINRL